MTWPVLDEITIEMHCVATEIAAAAAWREPEAAGQRMVVVGGLDEAARRLHHPVAADDERAVDRGELLDRLVHERAEDVPVLLLVAVKWIQHERLDQLLHLVRVAHDEQAADRPALPALDRQVHGHRQHPLEHLGLHVGRQQVGAPREQRLELALHVHHDQRVELVAGRDAPYAVEWISRIACLSASLTARCEAMVSASLP